MYKYIVTALMMGSAIAPALAIDVGGGGKLGGLGVSGGVGAGTQGASVGVGASVSGVGGANVGASASTSTGSVGVSTGASVGSTGASTGTGVGGNLGASGGATGGAGVSVGGGGVGVSTGTAVGDHSPLNGVIVSQAPAPVATETASGSAGKVDLPEALRPSSAGDSDHIWIQKAAPVEPQSPVQVDFNQPTTILSACREAIVSAATPLGAVFVQVVGAGPVARSDKGLIAPLDVQIQYDRQGKDEVRRAAVGCRLNASGKVTAISQA
jgi:hypothetical protein